jgi:hypothetical protein
MSATKPKDKESLEIYKLLFDFGQKQRKCQLITISHFWTEKINIAFQTVQLFSFMFACNYESWPLRWQGMYKESLLSILSLVDIGTYLFDDVMDDSVNRLIYSGAWIMFAAAMGSIYLLFRFVFNLSVLSRVQFQRIYFKIVHIFYLPVALGTIPAALCQYGDCQPSGSQLVVSILTLAVIGGYLVAYPFYLIVHVTKKVVTTNADAYEEFLRLKEMEYLLGISSAWLTEKLYLFSSYRSTYLRVYHRVVYYVFVLSMVIIHGALNQDNDYKMLILVIISGTFSLYITVLPSYRCLSSSLFYAFCMWLITANYFIGYLKASKYDSQTMADSNLVNILMVINIVGLIMGFIIILMIAMFRLNWDVGIESIKQLAVAYRFLLDDLRNSQKMILTLKSMTNFHFVRKEPIVKMEEILVNHYQLLSKEKHPLQFTVMEQLDILSFLREQVEDETLLPSFKLERDYGLLVRVVNRRWKEQILFNPIKRRILLKLGVLKLFLGERQTNPFNSGETGEMYKDKKNSEYDINKFYREFEEMESSREGIIENQFGREDINNAVRKKDFELLIQITISLIDANDQKLLKRVKKAWNKLGTSQLPQNIHQQLFS